MTDRPRGLRWVLTLLSCIRFDDVLVLQGAPALGAVLAMGRLASTGMGALSLLIVGNACLVAHVFLLNDWAGAQQDLQDPARHAGVFLERGIQRREIGALLMILLALSLAVFARLGLATLAIGVMIAVASALYSVPWAYVKGVPLASSLLHLVGGVLHFLLGWSVFRGVEASGVEIGLYFAVVFTAGHLTQEVRDVAVDSRNGIQTNAVRFGRRVCFVAAFGLFTLANALLMALAAKGVVPSSPAVVTALFYPLHGYWTLQALRGGLGPASVRRLQARYRVLYAGIGVAMVTCVLSR